MLFPKFDPNEGEEKMCFYCQCRGAIWQDNKRKKCGKIVV